MDVFPEIPEDLAALSDEDLAAFAEDTDAQVRAVSADPAAFVRAFVSETLSTAELLAAATASADALAAANAEIEARAAAAGDEDDVDAPEAEALSDEDIAAFAALSNDDADADEDEDDTEDDETEEPETAAVEVETPEVAPIVAAAPPARRKPLPRPSRARRVPETQERQVALTAASGAPNMSEGTPFPSMDAISDAMIARRRQFGLVAAGNEGEKIPIVRANWSDLYPSERRLGGDEFQNESLVAAAINEGEIKRELDRRRSKSLVASGGLCAPVTPYYQLAMVSTADRPVRAALPAFNADRGGIRYARPATLASITTGVGTKTAADDALGGTFATKACQVVDCPAFSETDVAIIYHCLQFGNLGARTFPERVTQWNGLTLAAHARLAESALLTGIDTASTQVTASSLGLGASANLFSQILAASSGMRSRHRMAGDTVLRIMLPWWAVYEIVSDVMRGQFERWDVDAARVTAMLRAINVEPTYYIDGASGRGQVYGTQNAGALLAFPTTVVWYLFPEGSFLYLDGGTLELGLVRDSVLNKTNDFQIFGETFENVAFVGVESLAVASTLCDSGVVAAPHALACPIDYTHTT